MSFIETVRRARELLKREGRLSLRALKREFDLDDEAVEELADELVEIRGVGRREGRALVWIGSNEESPAAAATAPTTTEPPQERDTAERRQLTVLFCDLVDSTRLAAGMDAEDWREVVRGYQQAAAEVIERFGGHVAQYLGDGLLVYFGWPRAHEDDAERAVRAGLGIVDAIAAGDSRLAVRIGIHTGPVVVGEMGGGATRETLAMGDTTNVAARIQGEAEPDTVALSSATLRLVSGIFATQDLGERELRGAGDFHLHRAASASGMRSRLDVAAAAGLTPLVGRDQELGLLEDRFAQVAEGLGQVVLICGEAGIGKSRLMLAFRERIAESSHSWFECRCSPYTQDSAFSPVLQLQRQGLGLGADVPPEERVARIEEGLAAVGFDLDQAMPLMAAFHGLPLPGRYGEPVLSPDALRKKTLDLLLDWLLRLSRLQPLVLLMEDLHWVDPSTQELIGQILERIPREQVLLLATYRPDFDPPWGAKSHLTPMLLARLTRAQIGDLVRKAARERDLPAKWVDEIARRTDGVPLFAEEVTKTVLESQPQPEIGGAAPDLHIPESLKDSLMARLDALGPVKELAQLGAVLGREFDYDLLVAVSPMKEADLRQALEATVREELFYQRGTPPEASYLFKHALIRDAAYESLLRATRQRHHLRVADTLIERMPPVAGDQPELVAHHLTEAGDAERAISWWQRAGDHAIRCVAYEEAIQHLRRGLALLESRSRNPNRDLWELEFQTRLGHALVAAHGYGHEDTGGAWERAESLCSDDSVRSGLISMYRATFLASHAPPKGLEHYRRTLEIGEKNGDELLVLAGCNGCGWIHFVIGEFSTSRGYFDRAESLYEPVRHRFTQAGFLEEVGLSALTWAEWNQWHLGFPDRAWRLAERTLKIVEGLGNPYSNAWVRGFASMTALNRGDWASARNLADETLAISEEHGFPLMEGLGRFVRIFEAGLSGTDLSAVDRSPEAMARMASAGNQAAAPWILDRIAELQLLAGRLPESLQAIEGGLALAGATSQHFRDAELHRLKGECFLKMEEHGDDDAEVFFHRAIDIARGQEAKSLELRAATSLARLWRDQRKCSEARELLQPVYDWFTEGFGTQDLVDAKALLEELSA